MARRYYSSTAARTTLAADINSSVTTVGVTAVTGWPTSFPYTIILDQDTINEEVVEVTARTGTTLTVIRGVDGTTGVAHSAGAAVNHGVSARDFDEPNLHVNTDVKHVLVVTSGTRPGSPADGQIIFETDTDSYFGWSGAEWAPIGGGGGATGGGDDQIFYENGQTVTTDYTLTTDFNAVTAGPISIDAAATVTIPSGSTWTVV
jgi:hypothetical protein